MFVCVKYSAPNTEEPYTMDMAAPKEAAEDTPRVKGLTRGFRSVPCMTDPAIARLAPVVMARTILGNLPWKRIVEYHSFSGPAK